MNLLLALLCIMLQADSVTPYTYEADGRTAYGFTADYADGTYVFYDCLPGTFGQAAETVSVPFGQTADAEQVDGIVVETYHSRDWTGSFTVLTDAGILVTIAEDPEDITSGDAVTLYYTDGQLTDVLVGHR